MGIVLLILLALCVFLGVNIFEKEEENKNKKKDFKKTKISKYELNFLKDYFWVIGLSLVVVGATKIFTDPLGILIAGIIILLIASVLKGILFKLDKTQKKDKQANQP
ncbi:MAG: hypothetical protein V1663_01745 [archaeon]